MQVYITAKYQNKEEISDCLETISKAVNDWQDRYPHLYKFDRDGDGIEVYIEPTEKSDILISKQDGTPQFCL